MTDNQPSNSPSQPFDVFLSHNTEDKPGAQQLAIRDAQSLSEKHRAGSSSERGLV